MRLAAQPLLKAPGLPFMDSFRKRFLLLMLALIAVTQAAVLVIVLANVRDIAQARAKEALSAGSAFEPDITALYRRIRNSIVDIDGVTLLAAGLLGAFLGRGASSSMGELMRAARRLREGHYDIPVEVPAKGPFRGLAIAFNAMQQNIAEREAEISRHAYQDLPTGLPNRAAAVRCIEEDILGQAELRARVALFLIDVRNIRQISASLGHRVGDATVREVSRCLQLKVASQDLLARVAESQFLVIARECSQERAISYPEELVIAVSRDFQLPEVSLDLRASCGVCWCDGEGVTADEFLRRAQVALQDAKETRKLVATYGAARDDELRRRLTVITDLRLAIDQDLLSLRYQPKVTMATRSVQSLEALVRWTHPRLGVISPGEFVPLAERTGGSRRLTSWVLNAAIRQMGTWRRAGLDVEVAVNLSAPDVLDPSLADEVLHLLRTHKVSSTSLLLEITESAVMRDPKLASRNMQVLRSAGVRFAIDDFGTGQSSLSQLSVLPVDELKIDRSLIASSHLAYEMERIANLTIELGHSIGLHVVAEGVEDPEVWNLLRRLGCDFAQGYLISAPLAADEVPSFIGQANQLLRASDSSMSQIRALSELAGRFRH
jgi:diguanylate cyclase